MALPLMPKATAVWLVENTALTFEQIAAFCGMHELEVQAIADGEVAAGIVGLDPLANGQLTKQELERCEKEPRFRLVLSASDIPRPQARSKGARYTPVSKRHDRPDAIAWLLKHHPELTDAQISKLIGTTKPTISTVRDKSHWNAANIKARNPVTLGLCSEMDLEKEIALAPRRAGVVVAPQVDYATEAENTFERDRERERQEEADTAVPAFLRTGPVKREEDEDEGF